ncbi:MAG: bifunctional DNA-formamidopyrimidine glycosylase/DNA-(apurinic or apyrimidinic site) lyase [Polyangiaceae bacterium]|nr:bifunctional DNA-formamidopyrimidine glycosylase/DNA-(apurinic or apyrimidinic site) lyase [Polyangiaceae bacterium]
MPELPEVEYARRCLHTWMHHATIEAVAVEDARILDDGTSVRAVVRALEGQRVLEVRRRGKWLRLELAGTLSRRSGGASLLFSHLGMTGKWVADAPDAPARRFEKVRLDVVKGRRRRSVRYLDPRLFGRFVIATQDLPAWTALGPDPLDDALDPVALREKLGRRSGPIKAVLLDQTVLAGVGNIQATEALFYARIDPRRSAKSIESAEVKKLLREIRASIDRTLALQEGPEIQYVEEAGATNPFTIYGREKLPCPRCKRPLQKMVLAGRGTVFCPHCQR